MPRYKIISSTTEVFEAIVEARNPSAAEELAESGDIEYSYLGTDAEVTVMEMEEDDDEELG